MAGPRELYKVMDGVTWLELEVGTGMWTVGTGARKSVDQLRRQHWTPRGENGCDARSG